MALLGQQQRKSTLPKRAVFFLLFLMKEKIIRSVITQPISSYESNKTLEGGFFKFVA